MDLWKLLGTIKSFYKIHPVTDKFHQKNRHRTTTAAAVAVVDAVAVHIVVSYSNPRRARRVAREPRELRVDNHRP